MNAYRAFLACAAVAAATLLPPLSAAPDILPLVPSVLPVLKPHATVLFIGDSITDGGRARKGSDYNHTMGQSFAFILAAQLGAVLAERDITFINRGVSGNRVSELQLRWKPDVLDLKPDVLSILVGINDTTRLNMVTTPEEFERGYDQLLADTFKTLPNVRIVLCEPFLLPAGKYKDSFAVLGPELQKRQDVVGRLAAKYKLPIIRLQQIFDDACKRAPAEHWSWDGIHPHYAGHALMAEAWIKAVSTLN